MRILVDTDVLVDHLRGQRRFSSAGDEVSVSSLTRAELYSGQQTDERRIDRLLASMTELPVDRPVAERAGRIRRSFPVRLPDALIAATAIEHGLALVTRNVGGYEPIRGLRLRESS